MTEETLTPPLVDMNSFRSKNVFMPKNIENQVGRAIVARLKELGKTQQWLADKTGVSNVSVHKWIHSGKISRDSLGAAALALGMTMDELMGQGQPEPAKDGPCKFSLEWINADEKALLEGYRQCTDAGKDMARAIVRGAPKEPGLAPNRNAA
jgi:transcriptional regulator with XRE-family HTH domain